MVFCFGGNGLLLAAQILKAKSMEKNILPLCAVFFWANCFAQTPDWSWAKNIGGPSAISDHGYSIALDDSANVYTTGTFFGTVDFDPGPGVFNLTQTGMDDIFISKLDSVGNFRWAKKLGGTGNDIANAITIDRFGNIYTTGSFAYGAADFDPGIGTYTLTGTGEMNIFISKLNRSGNFVWAKQLGGTLPLSSYNQAYGNAITVDNSGNVYTTGKFKGSADFDPGPGTFNMTAPMASIVTNNAFVSKLDSMGNFVWAINIGTTGEDYGRTIVHDTLGNVYIGGSFTYTFDFDPGPATYNLTATNAPGFVLKLDGAGNFISARNLGGDCYSLKIDVAGNIFYTGSFNGAKDFDPGLGTFILNGGASSDIFACKLNDLGNFVWAKRIGGSSSDNGNAIVLDNLSNVYITGNFNSTVDFDPDTGVTNLIPFNGSTDVFVCKLDSSGNFVWAKAAGGAGGEIGYSIALDAMPNVYITGHFTSPFSFFGQTILVNTDTVNLNAEIFIAKLGSTIITDNNIDEGASNKFFIFPNPVTDEISLEGLGHYASWVEVFDVTGQKISSLWLNSNKGNSPSIDVTLLPSGIYFIKVYAGKKTVVRKFVKM